MMQQLTLNWEILGETKSIDLLKVSLKKWMNSNEMMGDNTRMYSFGVHT